MTAEEYLSQPKFNHITLCLPEVKHEVELAFLAGVGEGIRQSSEQQENTRKEDALLDKIFKAVDKSNSRLEYLTPEELKRLMEIAKNHCCDDGK